MATKE
jgi:cytochrome b5